MQTVLSVQRASVFHGYVYKGAMKYPFVDSKETLFSSEDCVHLSNALIASNIYTCRYFGHWITEALTLELAARHFNVPAITPTQVTYRQQTDYRNLIGLNALPVSRARCDQLMILDDIAANRFKRDRMMEIRGQVRNKVRPQHSNHGVMFLRKTLRLEANPRE
ncbi:MAG: hypothetical protein U0936_03290 [Planctomycetaceae bacterium]